MVTTIWGAGPGHGGGGHYGGGHYGGGHYGGYHGGYYHHGGFYGGFSLGLGFYPGYYGGYYPGYYAYGGDYSPGLYRSYYYPSGDALGGAAYPSAVPLTAPSVPLPPLGSTVPPSGSINAAAGNAVGFSVRVPANAEIWIEGKKTNQIGPIRQFESPPLTPGVNYTYEIRARWTIGDNVVDQTRKVGVRAGDQLMVSFAEPAPAPKETGERPPQPAP